MNSIVTIPVTCSNVQEVGSNGDARRENFHHQCPLELISVGEGGGDSSSTVKHLLHTHTHSNTYVTIHEKTNHIAANTNLRFKRPGSGADSGGVVLGVLKHPPSS